MGITEEINELFRNAPRIGTSSFYQAYQEVREAIDDEAYPVLVVAAAIHEFSNLINDHLIEFYKYQIEKENK